MASFSTLVLMLSGNASNTDQVLCSLLAASLRNKGGRIWRTMQAEAGKILRQQALKRKTGTGYQPFVEENRVEILKLK